jgi:hypothetical protein
MMGAKMEAMNQYLAKLNARERRIAITGAVAALLLLILAIVLPLQRHVGAGEQRLERKRDDLIWLRSIAPQLAGLRTSAPPTLHESLVVAGRSHGAPGRSRTRPWSAVSPVVTAASTCALNRRRSTTW